MKHFIITACLVSAAMIGCKSDEKKTDETTMSTSDTASTTSKMDETPATPVDSATMMKNWEAYATPGPQHEMMAKWDGTWTGNVTMWMDPKAPPQTSTATAVNKMIFGGRYQLSTHKGNMMGMPFDGQSILGYDNTKKMYQSTWIDNMGTGIMMMEGQWDEPSKSMTMTGKMIDPSTGTGKEITMRHVFKVIDDTHHTFEMYCPGPDGKEFRNMEITMTKK